MGEEWWTGDTMSVSGSSASPLSSGLKHRPTPCPAAAAAAAWCVTAEGRLGSVEVALGRPKSAG